MVQTSNSTFSSFLARPNNDSGNNYVSWYWQMSSLSGTTTTSGIPGNADGTTSGLFALTDASIYFGGVAQTGTHYWENTTQWYWDGVNGTGMQKNVGQWASGTAVTSIVYLCGTGNINTGSRIITYGIR
jgi:hypothetical protein